MTRVRSIDAWMAFAGAGLCLLGAVTPLAEPQGGSDAPPPKLSRRPSSTKPAWHSGPATTPPQTEVVSPPPDVPPPAKSSPVGGQAEGKKPAVTKPSDVTPAASGLLPRHPSASANEPASTPNAVPRDDPNAPDPEVQRIRVELNRLRDDAGARRAFYDELRRTVERVRAGLPDEGSKNSAAPRPAASPNPGTSGKPANPPPAVEPEVSPPANPRPLQTFLGSRSNSFVGAGPAPALGTQPQSPSDRRHGSLDRAAYRRVVRNAKANGTPVPLALGVAWIESHLQTRPPRGAAGEVGMFQILPERCRIEGWPPKRLEEPEFNAWLGTLLLARYYKEEGSWARAAAKYVAGPGVFDRSYSQDLWAYIYWYASSVVRYAGYFAGYLS